MINKIFPPNCYIIYSSSPNDGLFYYSYEYSIKYNMKLFVFLFPGYIESDYINVIKKKYNLYKSPIFLKKITKIPRGNVFILGRSVLSFLYINFYSYTKNQQLALKKIFYNINVYTVYSKNLPIEFNLSISFFNIKKIINLCDEKIYSCQNAIHFEKICYFDIYKPFVNDIKYKYLFNGTNDINYQNIKKNIYNYNSYAILVDKEQHIDSNLNNIITPIDNILGIFNTYVYTKNTFDSAPRFIQECFHYNKKIIYSRNINDGGKIYFERGLRGMY